VVLEAGHCPHDEVPDQVNAALLEWLSALEPVSLETPAPRPAGAHAPAAASGRTDA
jgi:hypothetical protein